MEQSDVRIVKCPSSQMSELSSVRAVRCPNCQVSEQSDVRIIKCPSSQVSELSSVRAVRCPNYQVSEQSDVRIIKCPKIEWSTLACRRDGLLVVVEVSAHTAVGAGTRHGLSAATAADGHWGVAGPLPGRRNVGRRARVALERPWDLHVSVAAVHGGSLGSSPGGGAGGVVDAARLLIRVVT